MSIAENITRVEEQIAAACRNANRPRSSVQLMAVSKLHPAESILEAHAAGLPLFGENRVQEYAGKKPVLSAAGIFATQPPATFHCIGPMQSNKSTRAADLFDAIDTIDSIRLAERLDQAAAQANKRLPIRIEIKLSPEAAKHGLTPDSPELDQLFERLKDLHHLRPQGLMTVPPYAEDPEQTRPYFRQLRTLRDALAQRHPHLTLDDLSMGMSHDFAAAIEEGSTTVRIGTAIFGARPPALHST
jgi:pyridoxal phosphate enzyme (YggS family)